MTERGWERVTETVPRALRESRDLVYGLVLNLALITGVIAFG